MRYIQSEREREREIEIDTGIRSSEKEGQTGQGRDERTVGNQTFSSKH